MDKASIGVIHSTRVDFLARQPEIDRIRVGWSYNCCPLEEFLSLVTDWSLCNVGPTDHFLSAERRAGHVEVMHVEKGANSYALLSYLWPL